MVGSIARIIPLLVVLLVLIATLASYPGRAMHDTAAAPTARLAGGAASVEKLLDRFLVALRAKDRGALEALRVTEEEYRNVIIPGNVNQGEPPQRLSEEASEYFWSVLQGKSMYHREGLIQQLGGQKLTAKDIQFEKGVKQYAGYTAHKRLAATLSDEEGRELELRTGSIAEVDGRFKFISYIRD